MSDKPIHIVFQVINHLRHLCHTSTSDKLLLVTLASFSGVKGICPSAHKIGERMGFSDRQVYRVLNRLEDQKLIKIIRAQGKSHVFEFLFLSTTPDIHVIGEVIHTPDNVVIGTPDIHVIPPMTTLSYHRITKGITNRNNRGEKLPVPLDFFLTPKSKKHIDDLELEVDDANEIINKFLTYNAEKQTLSDDWNRMLRAWIDREMRFRREREESKRLQQPEKTPWYHEQDAGMPRGNALASIGKILEKLKSNGQGGHTNVLDREGKAKA